MQWTKAKTILIILFLILNIFLIFVAKNNSKDEFDVNALANLLTSNQISIDIDQIKNSKENISIPNINDTIVSTMLGNAVLNDNNTYINKSRSLKINDNNTVLYTDTSPNDSSFKNVTEKNVLKKLKPHLKKNNLDKIVYHTDTQKNNDNYIVKYNYKINKMDVYNSSVTFIVSKSGIISIEGNIYNINNQNSINYELISPRTILVQLCQIPNRGSINIKSVKLGIYIKNYENAITFQSIPVYEIITDSKSYYYDARVGVDNNSRLITDSNGG